MMFLTWCRAADAFGKTKPQANHCLRGEGKKIPQAWRLRLDDLKIGNSRKRMSLINSSGRRAKNELG